MVETSGYCRSQDIIVLDIDDGNPEDFVKHIGYNVMKPDRCVLCVNEIEMLLKQSTTE